LLLVLAFIGDTWIFSSSPRPWLTAAVSVGAVLFMLICQYLAYRHEYYGTCSEIRLSDDGTCELETKRQIIRLHVNEIRSVEFSPEDDENCESYIICYQGGKLDVSKEMTAFADFLTRLKALNPAVDLTSFPADTWPGLGGPAPERSGPVRRFVTSAVFPLIVIAFLVYIAIQTLGGN
jgi:hypothetical protein